MKRFSRIIFIAILSVATALPLVAAAFTDGKYLLDYKDPELGSVTVSVLVKDGRLASVELPKGPGDVALDEGQLKAFLSALVSAPDLLAVDAISGATQSSDLLKYAVQNALKLAVKK